MKDIIVICPTRDRAKMEFDRFLEFFGDFIVKRYNKYRMMITLKSDTHLIYMVDKGIPVISNDFYVCSLEEFKQMLWNIAERLKEKEEDGKENTIKSNQGKMS